MNQSKTTLLCVDDNRDNCELLTFVFEDQGFEVKTCASISEGWRQAQRENFSAIILDNRFNGTTSLETCRKIRSLRPRTPIIFYSGEARQSEIKKALAAGADAYLVKPNGFEKITETVVRLIEDKQVRG